MTSTVSPARDLQNEWRYQWSRFRDEADWLFLEWIWPRTLEDFRAKRVLDAGCGMGQHVALVAQYANHVVGLDLNTGDIARQRTADLPNVTIVEGDVSQYRSDEPFDVVYCVGVIHHTDDPDCTFRNLCALCRPGGLLIVWCYSLEGSGLVRLLLEPLRKVVLRHLPRSWVYGFAVALTLAISPVVHTFYRLPLSILPFYEYFENFRKLSFNRNVLNVFDKLNAPQTEFISRERIEGWFSFERFRDVTISSYKGVSWRASGRIK